jgi:hypothetical protein
VVIFTPRPLYPHGNSPWYLLGRRLGGLQSRSGSGGEEKNSQPLTGLEPPIIQPVAQSYTVLRRIFGPNRDEETRGCRKLHNEKLHDLYFSPNIIKVKVKLSLCLTKQHAMKVYWRSGGIIPRILDLGTRWM